MSCQGVPARSPPRHLRTGETIEYLGARLGPGHGRGAARNRRPGTALDLRHPVSVAVLSPCHFGIKRSEQLDRDEGTFFGRQLERSGRDSRSIGGHGRFYLGLP